MWQTLCSNLDLWKGLLPTNWYAHEWRGCFDWIPKTNNEVTTHMVSTKEKASFAMVEVCVLGGITGPPFPRPAALHGPPPESNPSHFFQSIIVSCSVLYSCIPSSFDFLFWFPEESNRFCVLPSLIFIYFLSKDKQRIIVASSYEPHKKNVADGPWEGGHLVSPGTTRSATGNTQNRGGKIQGKQKKERISKLIA